MSRGREGGTPERTQSVDGSIRHGAGGPCDKTTEGGLETRQFPVFVHRLPAVELPLQLRIGCQVHCGRRQILFRHIEKVKNYPIHSLLAAAQSMTCL